MSLVLFQFKDRTVRTVVGDDGKVLFVGKDVCEILGYSNPNDAMNDHCRGISVLHPLLTHGGKQEVRVLTEADVFRLIVRSKKPGVSDLADSMLSRVSESAALIKAVNEFEIPDDLPDMFVYVVRNTVTGNVKIGISRDPEVRLRQLQSNNDCKLELLATKFAENRFKDEALLHDTNSDYRIQGEWFTAEARMLDEVECVKVIL